MQVVPEGTRANPWMIVLDLFYNNSIGLSVNSALGNGIAVYYNAFCQFRIDYAFSSHLVVFILPPAHAAVRAIHSQRLIFLFHRWSFPTLRASTLER